LYRLFNIGTDSAVEIFGQSFIWFLSDCKYYPCHDFPNLESLLQDYFALFRGLTIYVIWKYQMKFKFLSAALAGLFLTFSSVVDAAPVRYDFIGGTRPGGSVITVTGYVVLGNGVTGSGVNAFDSITDWSFDWNVAGSSFSRGFGDGALAGGSARVFSLDENAQVASANFCVTVESGGCGLPSTIVGVPTSFLIIQESSATVFYNARVSGSGSFADISSVGGTWTGPVAVPEPSTLSIFALGIMGLALRRFKKQS
jgi:hypothetical protein